MNLSDKMTPLDIRKWAGNNTTYRKGLAYFNRGNVLKLVSNPDSSSWCAEVEGNKVYHVDIMKRSEGIDGNCDCPAYASYQTCKHIIAVLFEIQNRQNNLFLKRTTKPREFNLAEQLIRTFIDKEKKQGQIAKKPLKVEYICKSSLGSYEKHITIELKVGDNRTYVVKNLVEFLKCVSRKDPHYFAKNFTYDPKEHYFVEEDLEIIQILIEVLKNQSFFREHYSYFGRKIDDRTMKIPPLGIIPFLEKIQGRSITFEHDRDIYKEIQISTGHLPFAIQLDKETMDSYKLDLTSLKKMAFFDEYDLLFTEGVFYTLTPDEKESVEQLKNFIRPETIGTISFNQAQMEPFVTHVLPSLKKISKVVVDEQISDRILSYPLVTKIYLDLEETHLVANVSFHYGDRVIHPMQPDIVGENQDVIFIRDMVKEREIIAILEATMKKNGQACYIDTEEKQYEFLFLTVPKLQELAEIYMTNAVKSLIFAEDRPSIETSIEMESSGNLLEINFSMDGITDKEIRQVLQSIVEKKRYHRLPNGAFLSLEQEDYKDIDQLLSDLKISKTQLKKGPLQVPVYRGLQIEDTLAKEHSNTKLGAKFRRLIQDLKNPDTLEIAVPNNLYATLRDYQNYGFQWMKTLAHYRLGGILADDMGLGKTLQSIAYLLSEKSKVPSLIIAPASLVYNWKNEFTKFAPDLNVTVLYGSPDERHELLIHDKPDVFITSYPSLRQDQDLYEKMVFDSLILDEAQAIKNHQTKTTKAVGSIQAAKRFALSGTPIENSLDELWSIFDVILPGFFPSKKAFNQLPKESIAKYVRPFILRRVKKDVLKELPDKIETVYQSELTKDQKELYLAYLERIQSETMATIQSEGFEKSRIKILAGLTRLRQLCCHPSLFLDHYKGTSGKLMELIEVVENATQNKRRLLIFSQFTSMLGIIQEKLTQLGLDYFYLDGSTKSKERVEMTERFNQGEKQIFLISLKAGGTGLNLTGADTVILYDLWWNPAIEEQAAGRAHRIGQKQVVQVIRLISRGTIEEKIYELQEKKKELIEQVIQPGESMLSSISENELKEILDIK